MTKTFWFLLKTDLLLLNKTIKDKIINVLVWGGANVIISSYLLQAFGISESFGVFQVGSVIIAVIGFELYVQMFVLVADIEGCKHINYHLTLPISNKLVLLKMVTLYTINGVILALIILPLSKIILWHKLDLFQINVFRFMLTLLVTSIFFGAFTLFLSSFVKHVGEVENIIVRILFPIWFFGCFQFSWKVAYDLSPILAYLSFVSPYTFATEALRSSMLDPQHYIPFWINIVTLMFMTIPAGIIGYKRIKNRLDFI